MSNVLFTLTEEFVKSDLFISTDKYFFFASSIPGITYEKREALYHFDTWRGYNVGPLIINPRKIIDRVIVVGHSDNSLSGKGVLPFQLLGARKLFGVNTYPFGRFAEPLPLGLTNFTNESIRHSLYGNTNHFVQAWNSSSRKSVFAGKIYANFSTQTHKGEREALMSLLRTMKHVVIDKFQSTELGRINYLKKLRIHEFTVCPRGNGIDTHRLWETLYMGGIPIVRQHPIMEYLLADLPVLFVKDWNEIGRIQFLEEKWYEILSKNYNYEKLKISFWLNRIKSSVNPRRLTW